MAIARSLYFVIISGRKKSLGFKIDCWLLALREEQGDQEKYGEKTENNKNESDFMRNIAEKTLLLALLRKPKMCTFNTCEQLLMDKLKISVQL